MGCLKSVAFGVEPSDLDYYYKYIPLPSESRYIEVKGKDLPGHDVGGGCHTDLRDNVPAIEALCSSTPGCVAFNSLGCLKSAREPLTEVPGYPDLNFFYIP